MGMFEYTVGQESLATEATVAEESLVCTGLNNQSYTCDSGHCCGETQCCSYYYELWWFWLVWTLIGILTCCCLCQHWRSKQRFQQQRRQNEINLIAYREAHNNSQVPLYLRFLPSSLLPAYDEAVERPATPPPPYTPVPATPLPPPPPPAAAAADALEEPCCHAATSVPSDAPCPRVPEALLPHSQSTGKDLMQGRYRRFTGDSGIEVFDGQELWDPLGGFLPREEADDGRGQTEEACVGRASPGCQHADGPDGLSQRNANGHAADPQCHG